MQGSKQQILPRVAKGDWIAAFALSEADAAAMWLHWQ